MNKEAEKKNGRMPLWILRVVLILLAAFLTGFGWMNGGFRENWMKACVICLECIGLG